MWPTSHLHAERDHPDRIAPSISSGNGQSRVLSHLTSLFSSDINMRTLFSENILSPSPQPSPQTNPFELHFASSLSKTSTNSSTQSSPKQYEWLTQLVQSQQRADAATTEFPHHEADGHRKPPSRRRGNPKLLFMGPRKSVLLSGSKLMTR